MTARSIPSDGVTDHGLLTGLADDDHTQYHTDARGDARYFELTGDTVTGIYDGNDITNSTSGGTGSIHTDGGLGVVQDVFVDGSQLIADSLSVGPGSVALPASYQTMIISEDFGDMSAVAQAQPLTIDAKADVLGAPSFLYGIDLTSTFDGTGTHALSEVVGAYFRAIVTAGSIGTTVGFDLLNTCKADGVVNTAIGSRMTCFSTQGQTTTTYNGTLVQTAFKGGGGILLNAVGHKINALGATTSNVGVDIDKQTGATTNIGILMQGDGAGADLVMGGSQDVRFTHENPNTVLENLTGTGAFEVRMALKTGDGRIKNTTRVTGATYQLLVTDEVVFYNTDAQASAATLPAGVEGATHKIINSGTSSNDLTVDGSGSEKLLGATTVFTLTDGNALDLTYNVAEGGWY